MELKDILELVRDSKVHIGLSYIGQNDYTITTKQAIMKENRLLNNKVSSINAFKNGDKRILGIKIFKKFQKKVLTFLKRYAIIGLESK